MAKNKMFDSALQSSGNQAGVFEYDGDTAYFYLYDTKNKAGRKVIATIRVLTSRQDFMEKDVAIRWDSTESKVGLFINEKLWAVFDSRTGEKFGGEYCIGTQPKIPMDITIAFELKSEE